MSVPRPRALRPYSADLRFLAGGGTMGARMRAHDWAATPLGPAEGWPQSLRSSVSTCLNCSFPILLWWGPDLVKLYNDAYVPIIGDKHPDALGRPGREVWPEIWDTIGPMLRRVTEYGEAAPADDLLLLLCRHGYSEECYFSFSYSPIHDESGGVGGIFCPVLETTAKVIGARRLRTVSNLGALDRAPSADAAATACARVMAGNDADLPFALIYLLDRTAGIARLAGAAGIAPGAPGAPPEIPSDAAAPWPMVSIPADGAVIPDLRGRFAGLPYGAWTDPPEQALALPIPLPGEAESSAVLIAGLSPRKRLDDEYRAFLSLVASLIGGHIADAVALAAERRRVEALAELDQAKTTFFSNVSHEFRTPLTLMLGPLEELLSRAENLPPADRACAEVAYRNGLRLLRLVNALLDFSRVEANRAHVRLQPTDLAALTTELASTFQSLCERGGLSLTIDCPALPEPVWVDQAMWEKVVLNLLSNAFKFTFEGGIQVLLRPSADGQAAELSVVDTGTGIPSEELPRLFERFHRIEGARGRSHEGSGIGLALVQELVRLHGGEVTVESELDQGTAFTVAVPFGAAGLPAERVGQGRTAVQSAMRAQAFVEEALRWLPDGKGTSTEADAVRPPPGRGLSDFSFPTASDRCGRVLVADDNADMRDYVSRLLAGIGCEVEAVPNGEAALAAARQRIPDLILSDVMMPGLDGVSLLRALRSEPGLAEIPFLLVSARAGEEARIEGLDAGADDYVTKPFTARELVARVGANLNLGRLRRDPPCQ